MENARKGKGPTLIECKTYRHRGHSRIDPAKYRPEEEVDNWLKKDPIIRLKKKILEEKLLGEAEIKRIEKEVSTRIKEAVRFAKESEHPKSQEALEDVYANT